LPAQPFNASNSRQLLEQSAQRFINHAQGVQFAASRLTLSSIYDWYADDFGN
jgi:hypothetical protein